MAFNSFPGIRVLFSVIFLLGISLSDSIAQNYGDPDSLRKVLKTQKSDTGKVSTILRLSKIAKNDGHYDSSLVYGRQALELSEQLGYAKGIGQADLDLGVTYWYVGNFADALQYNYAALEVYQKLGDKRGLSQAYNNMGIVYASQKNYPKALECYLTTLGIKQELGDEKAMASTLINIGAVYDLLKEYEKSFNYYNQALAIKREMKDEKGEATCLLNIGLVHHNLKNLDSAVYYYERSLELRRKNKDRRGVVSSLISISKAYFDLGQFALCEKNLLEAEALSAELGTLDLSRGVWLELATLYDTTGRYKQAMEAYIKYSVLKDSVNLEEANRKADRLELNYEFEKEKLEMQKEQEKKDALTEEARKRQTLWIILVSSVLVLVIGFTVFLFSRFRIIRRQKSIIEHQKQIVEEKSREVFDSINYAKRIQYTLLAHDSFLKAQLRNFFVFYQPKDIVSGDFYWATEQDGKFYLAVCDSTGHGVPGAFMSLLNISFLNEAITEKKISEPNRILDFVREKLVAHISQEGAQDGMDGTLICIDKSTGTITYAAANTLPVIVSEGQVKDGETDKMPVGKGERNEPFRLFTLHVAKGDMVYLFTDGFADQFGGEKGKKFKYTQLKESFGRVAGIPAEKQREELEKIFTTWKGNLDQVDDVCVIGIRI